jgi:undecaprenyl-diphosphatase
MTTRPSNSISRRPVDPVLILIPALFAAAAVAAFFFGDLRITQFLQRFDNPYFHWLMVAVSWPGYQGRHWVVALSAAALLLRFRRKVEAAFLLAGLGSVMLITSAIKLIVARPRPAPGLVKVDILNSTYSYPSGHVTSYLALFGFLFYLVHALMRPSALRSALLAVFGALIGLVGLSRVYLGAHWASDALTAYCLGFLWLGMMIHLYEKFSRRA